jgi:hypothetical protein
VLAGRKGGFGGGEVAIVGRGHANKIDLLLEQLLD